MHAVPWPDVLRDMHASIHANACLAAPHNQMRGSHALCAQPGSLAPCSYVQICMLWSARPCSLVKRVRCSQ